MVRAQRAPYQPAQAAIVRLPGWQAALRIDFAAPSPLGAADGRCFRVSFSGEGKQR